MELTRIHYLDASAIVKLFINEPGSEAVRSYFYKNENFSTTYICFGEALGVFKDKFLRGANMDFEKYLFCAEDLISHVCRKAMSIDKIDIIGQEAFDEVHRLVDTYSLDFSLALQLYTLKKGYLSTVAHDSEPILITADKKLSEAARSEKLRAWDCINETKPVAESDAE